MRKFRIALLLYAAFDLFIGGIAGGLFQLTPLAAAQQNYAYGNITTSGSTCSLTTTPLNCVTLPLDAQASAVAVQVIGTYTGTNQFEITNDNGTTWVNISCTPPNSATAVSSTTSTGLWQCNVAGYTHFRVRASALSSGTAAITITMSHAIPSIISGAVGGSGTSSTNVQGAVAVGGSLTGVFPLALGATDSSGNVEALACSAPSAGKCVLSTGLINAGSDGISNANVISIIQTNGAAGTAGQAVAPNLFNGTTWDRQRGLGGSIATGAAQTGVDGFGNTSGAQLICSNNAACIPFMMPLWMNGAAGGTAVWDRQFHCANTAKISALGASTALLVTGVAAKKVYICTLTLDNNSATATNVKIVEGTGATCGTGTADLTGLFVLGANTLASDHRELMWGAQQAVTMATAADSICLTGSAAGSVEATVTYDIH